MARIELRHATIRVASGFGGTGAVNEPTTPPADGDTDFDIDTVVVNGKLGTDVIPIGARFTVVGASDEAGLVKPKAVVALSEGFTASDETTKELQDFVKEKLALHKYPRFVEYVDALPRTERGKVNRAEVKADGTLRYRASQGSIHRLGAEVQGKQACNGWTFWHYERNGKLQPIDVLRDQAKRELGLVPAQIVVAAE